MDFAIDFAMDFAMDFDMDSAMDFAIDFGPWKKGPIFSQPKLPPPIAFWDLEKRPNFSPAKTAPEHTDETQATHKYPFMSRVDLIASQNVFFMIRPYNSTFGTRYLDLIASQILFTCRTYLQKIFGGYTNGRFFPNGGV